MKQIIIEVPDIHDDRIWIIMEMLQKFLRVFFSGEYGAIYLRKDQTNDTI